MNPSNSEVIAFHGRSKKLFIKDAPSILVFPKNFEKPQHPKDDLGETVMSALGR